MSARRKTPAIKKSVNGRELAASPGSAVVNFRGVADHSCDNCRFFSRKTGYCKFPGVRWDKWQLPDAPKKFVCDSWQWMPFTRKDGSAIVYPPNDKLSDSRPL